MSNAGSERGFTLIECAVVCALVGIVSAIALPSLRGHELRSARVDAVAALTRLQAAQEQHRALHGLYAIDLQALRGVGAASAQGRYAIELAGSGPDGYRAIARAQGVQLHDSGCPELTLEVANGFARPGPSARCWNR